MRCKLNYKSYASLWPWPQQSIPHISFLRSRRSLSLASQIFNVNKCNYTKFGNYVFPLDPDVHVNLNLRIL